MANPKGFILYRIWYGENLAYLGRTKQPLQSRIHGHLFKKPMHRSINIDLVTKIEYAEFQSDVTPDNWKQYISFDEMMEAYKVSDLYLPEE